MKKWLVLLWLVPLLLVSVACAKEEASMPMSTPAPLPESSFITSMSEGRYQDDEGDVLPSSEERMIVRGGEVSLVVDDVLDTRDKIAQLATDYGGYVVSSRIRGEEEDLRGYITIRVPDDKFEQALVEIGRLAIRVTDESTSSQDVTEEYVDLNSRLKNAEATEQQYLNLLDKATSVEDIIKIYQSLSQVRQEIEQIKGRMQLLERLSSMSRIEINLKPEASTKPLIRAGWNALEVLKSAIRGLITAGQVICTLAIWLLIFIPIWGTILGIIIWRLRKRKKTKAGIQ